MTGLRVSVAHLRGPAGNITPAAKKVIVSQLNLRGNSDKRVLVSALSLEAPPPDKRVLVAQAQLVGPNSAARSVYRGGTSGWQPAEVYFGSGGQWIKVV